MVFSPGKPGDPYADMRPEHDGQHWITNLIRSYMIPPLEREENLTRVLTKINAGAKEMKEKWDMPLKVKGYWRSPANNAVGPNELAEKRMKNLMLPRFHGSM